MGPYPDLDRVSTRVTGDFIYIPPVTTAPGPTHGGEVGHVDVSGSTSSVSLRAPVLRFRTSTPPLESLGRPALPFSLRTIVHVGSLFCGKIWEGVCWHRTFRISVLATAAGERLWEGRHSTYTPTTCRSR